MPSAARKITCSRLPPDESVGKAAGSRRTAARGVAVHQHLGVGRAPRGPRRGTPRSPVPVNTPPHSMPLARRELGGDAPPTPTRQTCLRSMSPWLEREDHVAPVGRERRVLHLEVAGGEVHRRPAAGRQGPEVQPPGLLPREDDPIARRPVDLAALVLGPPHAARALVGGPDAGRVAVRRVRDQQRPREAGALRLEREGLLLVRDPNEREALAVGRPGGRAVVVGARREVADACRPRLPDADEAVIAARALERQHPAVGRPGEVRRAAADGEELLRLCVAGERRSPDLSLVHERDQVALR